MNPDRDSDGKDVMPQGSGETPADSPLPAGLKRRTSRRSFLRNAAIMAVGASAVARFLSEAPSAQAAAALSTAPNTGPKSDEETKAVTAPVASPDITPNVVMTQSERMIPLISQTPESFVKKGSDQLSKLRQLAQTALVGSVLNGFRKRFFPDQLPEDQVDNEAAEDLSWVNYYVFRDKETGVVDEKVTRFFQESLKTYARAGAYSPKVRTLVNYYQSMATPKPEEGKSLTSVDCEVNRTELSPGAVPEAAMYYMIPTIRLYSDGTLGLTCVLFDNVISRFDLKEGGLFTLINLHKFAAYREAMLKMAGGLDVAAAMASIEATYEQMYKDSYNGFQDLWKEVKDKKDPVTGQPLVIDDLTRYIKK